jgi:3-isopropylmalate/(R)-2-methylmalate dehydratase small subunit
MTRYQGSAHICGDYIYPARFAGAVDLVTAKPNETAEIDPEFARRVKPGDILVAGEKFGGKSPAPDAALALQSAGIGVVLAKSFEPAFVTSATSAGLPLFVVSDHRTEMEDPVTIDTERGVLVNGITGHEAAITPVHPASD